MLWSSPVSAQEYGTPSDHQHIEVFLSTQLTTCLRKNHGFESDSMCASSLFDTCTDISPHGETTAGFSICGGVVSNVLDREMNVIWSMIKQKASPTEYAETLASQRNWLGFRKTESAAATRRYAGGSMSAYSGWIRYNQLSSNRVARLRELHRELE